jgi:predicted ATP-dependent endonuclease of OLD family
MSSSNTIKNLTLSEVHFKGYKSIENLKVNLEKGLNILIGKNASGKSNFLECLYIALIRVRRDIPIKYSKLKFISSDGDFLTWESERDIQKQNLDKETIEERIGIKEKLFINDHLVFDNSERKKDKYIKYQNRDILALSAKGILRRIGHHNLSPTFIKFNLPYDLECISIPGVIKIPIEENTMDLWEIPPTLSFLAQLFFNIETSYEHEGDKIDSIDKASFYKKLKIKEEIIRNLRKHSPISDVRFNENINVYKQEKLITIENIKLDFKVNSDWIPWSSLSDGTKRLFYLISEISNKVGGLVLVEEPELGIHPHQFHLTMEFLKEESEEKQIIISTHSPQSLNYLKEDEMSRILITYYDRKKGTQLKHLTKIQINKAKKYIKEVGFLSDYWMLSDLEP